VSDSAATGEPRPAKPKRWRRWLKRLLVATPVTLLVLWILVHRVPWLGSFLADSLRSIIGVEAVSRLEDFAYSAQDRFNRFWRADEKPKAYWTVPDSSAAKPLPTASASADAECEVPPFQPLDAGPVHKSWSAPGDGQWVAIKDSRHPLRTPRMFKTLVHPDKYRSWAAVSIVAMDRRQVKLHMMAGRHEPKARTREARSLQRPALIPAEHHGALLAAFNGGFKAVHGYYGMKIDNVVIIKPRPLSCIIAMFPGEELLIGDWERLKARVPEALWWRQTPACMVDQGKFHDGLVSEKNTYWGATLNGDTVIRRSALGLSKDGRTLYSGIGDHTTARAIAVAMKHVGANHVAQLDVNWSYPKFVVYEPRSADDEELIATKLCDGFEFSEGQFIRHREARDFFYITSKSDELISKEQCRSDARAVPSALPSASASASGTSSAVNSAPPASSAP
jgi:hypothetical protein